MSAASDGAGPHIDTLRVATYVVPTDGPESDGTFEWDTTTAVIVEAGAGGVTGLGYTYADRATAVAVRDALGPVVVGQDAFATAALYARMVGRVRNVGRAGIAAMAVSAVDVALRDLKARLLGVPLAALLGWARRAVPAYGSGGFTSYGIDRLQR
jgi:L-alanine-DL-glutamate epimerase-like enolase superfamily enzyme